jgi:phage terminase small subunit
MPVLRNPRHERFAQFLASGKTTGDAYEQAGYKRNASNASHMARNAEITNRVTEINNDRIERERVTATAAAERAVVTRQSLIEKQCCLHNGNGSRSLVGRCIGIERNRRFDRHSH